MPRLNPVQKAFIKNFISKLLFFPAIWFFMWAIYPLAFPFDLTVYIMQSLFNWLLFVVTIMAAVFVELLSNNPEIRAYFTHLERGKRQQTTEEPRKQKREKADKVPIY